ncbi:MAG: S8 family serine peptidase, partial [Dehalococcoidales bacterium]|nr:S8 family serine peptidase [Dehalococcoidales bacterium]
ENNVIQSVNFTSSESADDIYGHGTHVAGIIAAEANNGKGIAGIAPFARLLNVKVADDRGRCESSAVAKGIIWAVDHGARIINLSLEIKNPSQELQSAIDYAWAKGAVLVAAGSN